MSHPNLVHAARLRREYERPKLHYYAFATGLVSFPRMCSRGISVGYVSILNLKHPVDISIRAEQHLSCRISDLEVVDAVWEACSPFLVWSSSQVNVFGFVVQVSVNPSSIRICCPNGSCSWTSSQDCF